MIQPAPKTYDAKKSESEIQEWWETNEIYTKTKNLHVKDPVWFFLDGPPYASGAIHLGTTWNKIIKDTILRYKTMRGLNVFRQPGWDCHGLPIEVMVEGKLGIKSKKEIEQTIGTDRFIDECKRWAVDHIDLMTKQFKRLGVWMDWNKPYVTFTNDYIESAWWTLKRAHEKGLMQKSMRVIHWCPRCETALAEHEVRGEYYEVEDPSLYARFKLIDKPNEYLLIWTTTPWTLPADVSVCIHPEHLYSRVKVGQNIYIIAEDLVSRVMNELGIDKYQITGSVKGKELEGLHYEHPLLREVPKQQEFRQHHRVICGEHVTLEEGTGCVHTAPGFGEEDFAIGIEYDLPIFSPVGPDGKFTDEAGKYSGLFVKDADPIILKDLQQKGVLVKHGVITHSYPHCWRCNTPLIFRATEQWFLRVSDLKPRILEKNSEVSWVPNWMAERYVNGVESVGDWCISRQRYWGIPLPIWTCQSCGHMVLVGGYKELAEMAQEPLPEIDLHRSDLDKVVLRCPKCQSDMKRVPDVLDVWFDSSICSWASLNYPKKRGLFNQLWPSVFITEGEDQVTKWFYAQQVASIIALDEIPYKQVLTHGFALDAQGRKMSKSLGNVVDPSEVIDKHGADVLRFYMLSSNPPWEDLKFNWKSVDVIRRILNVLWNVYVFTTTYMSLDEFDPTKIDIKKIQNSFKPEDLWLISRINSTARDVTDAFERYDLHIVSRTLANFVLEDLSRWYVKLVRPRTWIERDDPTKLAAYITLYQALHILIRLLAPLTPHVTEVMYQGLIKAIDPTAPESVHMLSWPVFRREDIDAELERGMNIARTFVDAGATARQQANLKLRWPVAKAVIQVSSSESKGFLKRISNVLKSQLNCKELILLGPEEKLPEGLVEVTTNFGCVGIDTQITSELRAEGLARELVRRLQMMRKDKDLAMEERIDIAIGTDVEEHLRLLATQRDYITREVRVRDLQLCRIADVGQGYSKDWKIDNYSFRLVLKRY